MKPFFLLFILFTGLNGSTQDTLYHPVAGLGSEEYVLFTNGTFIFKSYLCGSAFVSFGDYKKNIFGYEFTYDTTRCPSPFLIEEKIAQPQDSIHLFFFNMIDSLSTSIFGEFVIGGQHFRCDTSAITVSKHNFSSDTLAFKNYRKEITFVFDTSSTSLKIYIQPNWFSYKCGTNQIDKLKKTRYGYLTKSKVYDEVHGKPWKKKKRTVGHYHQLVESKNSIK